MLLIAILFLFPHARSYAADLAITVDDLPGVGDLPPGVSRLSTARQLIRVLKKHKIPEVYGFVNGDRVRYTPYGRQILKEWVAAGFHLGNHTYSHPDLKNLTAGQFVLDIAKNEDLLKELSGKREFRFFRYPFLSEGNTKQKRDSVRRWLAGKRYRIAQVTVDYNDWAWSEAFARCTRVGDTESVQKLRQSYLNQVASSWNLSQKLSRIIFNRQIRHVLLVHMSPMTAAMLDQVLASYKKAGAHYVGLSKAMNDIAYSRDTGYVSPDGMNFLNQIMEVRKLEYPPFRPVPYKQIAAYCR